MTLATWRLYSLPIRLALLALMALVVFGLWLPAVMRESVFLVGIGSTVRNFGAAVFVLLASASIMAGLYRHWLLHRWERGAGRYCSRCGGLVIDRSSRRRFYQECIHCGRRFAL
jgi:hypothetical protein